MSMTHGCQMHLAIVQVCIERMPVSLMARSWPSEKPGTPAIRQHRAVPAHQRVQAAQALDGLHARLQCEVDAFESTTPAPVPARRRVRLLDGAERAHRHERRRRTLRVRYAAIVAHPECGNRWP